MFTPRHSTSTDARFQKILTNSPIPKSVRKIYETLVVQQKPASGQNNAVAAAGAGDVNSRPKPISSIIPSLQKARDESMTVVSNTIKPAEPGNQGSISDNHETAASAQINGGAGEAAAVAVEETTTITETTTTTTTAPPPDVPKPKARAAVIAKKKKRRANHARNILRSRQKVLLPAVVTPSGRDASGLRRSGRSSGPRDYWVLGSAKKTPIYNEVVLRNYEKRGLIAKNPELLATPVAKTTATTNLGSKKPKSAKDKLMKANEEKVEASPTVTRGKVIENTEYDLSEPEG